MYKMKLMNSDVTPLVSVCVITYNSSNYILDTLESIKAQTYKKIELIISDDCSNDHTVDICQKWIQQNKDFFVRVEFIFSKKNTGISANCNRAYKRARGEWIKGIAGDDLLADNCIEKFVSYAKDKECLYFCKLDIFGDSIGVKKQNVYWENAYSVFSKKIDEQFKYFIEEGNFIPTPAMFVAKETMRNLNYFDERIKLCEDLPFFYKCLSARIKLVLLNETLVKYRVSSSSVQLSPLSRYSSNLYYVLYVRKSRWRIMYARMYNQLSVNSYRNRILDFIHSYIKKVIS